MLLSLSPPRYGSARTTPGMASAADIVRVTKFSVTRAEISEGRPWGATIGIPRRPRYVANETTTASMKSQYVICRLSFRRVVIGWGGIVSWGLGWAVGFSLVLNRARLIVG